MVGPRPRVRGAKGDQILVASSERGGAPAMPAATSHPNVMSIESLILDHHASVYRYAYRLTGRQQDAEDLTQQTFMLAQQKLHQVREPSKVAGWLFAILRSRYTKSLRKPFPFPAANFAWDVEDLVEDLENVDVEPFDRDQLQAALNQIPDEFKLVLLAFYFEELSYAEISDRFNVPIGTVMSRLSRGKARLKQLLIEGETSNTVAAPPKTSQASRDKIFNKSSIVIFPKPKLSSPGGEALARGAHG